MPDDAPDTASDPRAVRPPARVLVRAGRPTGAQPQPPTSKYYTLRYTLAAFLAAGESLVLDPARSDDTDVLLAAIRALGGGVFAPPASLSAAEPSADNARGDTTSLPPAPGGALLIRGCASRPQLPEDGVVRVGNAGAVLRLLLGIGALLPEIRFETPYPDSSLGTRPNADLLAALAQLGVTSTAREPGGLLPITLHGGPPAGGDVTVSGARSSQYLSALLYLAPLTEHGLRIAVADGLRSAPLVRATLRALATAGIAVDAAPDLLSFHVPGRQAFRAGTYHVPGDGPSAAALIAAALALQAPLTLHRLDPREHDIRALLAALATMRIPLGPIPTSPDSWQLAAPSTPPSHRDGKGNGELGLGVRIVDGDACIDSIPALVAAACFSPGETRFERVSTLRLKESDRIHDLCAELTRAGCDVTPEPDAITVRGQPEGIEGGIAVFGHQDHRLIQALAIVALRSRQGLTIEGADHVAKSYPWFFADLATMGADIMPLDIP